MILVEDLFFVRPEIKPILDLWVVPKLLVYCINRRHNTMLDLCYNTNIFIILTLVRISLTGDASPLFEVCFVLENGPLLWAIPFRKNRHVFHDLTKQTNISIHCLPAIVVNCIRWCRPDVELQDLVDFVSWIVYPVVQLVLACGVPEHGGGPAAEHPLR